jgi:hypothetical protein
LSTSPYGTNISSQYNCTHYNDNAQHYTALGTTVLNAPHFLCRTKVSAHICLLLMYISIDQ